MPKTNKECPPDNTAVKFRVTGDKHLHEGTYTDAKGFVTCNGFICVTMDDVDYWRAI